MDAWIGVSQAGEMACVHMPTVCMSYNDQDMQCVSNTPLPYDLFIRLSGTGSRPVVLHQVSIGTHAVGQGGYADSIGGPKPKYLCGLVCLPSQQGGYCGPASIRIRVQNIQKYIDAVSGPRSTAYDRLTLAHMAVSYYSLQVVSLQSIVTLKSLAEGLQKYAWHGKLPKKQK